MTGPRIVITGITTFRNRGVEALAACTVRELRRHLPDAIFTVLDRGSEYDAARLPLPGVAFMQDGTLRRLNAAPSRRLVFAVAPRLDTESVRARREIATADAVVASGGDVFCSEYGHHSLLGHLEPLRIALRHRVPFFLHAQSIGPFRDEADVQAFMKIAPHAAGITVRERASWHYLTEVMKFSAEKILHTADPAFLLQPTGGPGAQRHFDHLRVRKDRPTVALSVSQAVCHWMREDAERHVETWLEIIGWLRRDLDVNVILIPHVQEISDGNNDSLVATELQRRAGWDPHVRVAAGDLSAADFKAIISRCDFTAAERMHAAVASLSSGVPLLAIGYSVKAEGILTDMMGAELAKTRALISIHDFLQPGTGLPRVQEAWNSRSELAAVLQASLPGARERAAGAFNPILARLGLN